MCCMTHIQNPAFYRKFRHWCILRHIQPYCGIFRTLCNSCIFRTMPYSKSWHIENEETFRTLSRHILSFRTLCNVHILRTLRYSTICCIQNFGAYLGHNTYLESCLYRQIQEYSGIFDNNSYNNVNFMFFTLVLHTFQ